MKKLLILTICISLSLGLVGCGCGSKDDSKLSDDKRVAVTVDGTDVYLDEAKYYAYSAQATNEIFFLSNPKYGEIDWNEKIDGATYQDAIKGEVLDSICEREYFYAKKDDYNVKLDSNEKKEVDNKVKNYFDETNPKLKDKIGISEKRLKEIFEKDALATKVEDVLEAEEKGSASKEFKEFLDSEPVECEKCWSEINFQEHIFSKTDVENETGLATEVTEEADVDVSLESTE